MARQEFLSGGFIGKLGQVVGQHWKNKRYVRTYVVPNNPNTPAQQANRAAFAKATKLAQQAMNINKGADYWQYGERTEFQNRVGTARRRLIAGLPDSEALPLYPDGYVDDSKITGVSFQWLETPGKIILTSQSPVLDTSRVFTIAIHDYNRWDEDWWDYNDTVTIPAGQAFKWEGPWDSESSYPEGSWIEAATSDDATHGDKSISLDRLPLLQPSVPYLESDFSLDEPSFSDTAHTATFEPWDASFPYTYSFTFQVRTWNYNTNQWYTPSYTANVINGVLQNIVIPWNNTHGYPAGARIIRAEGRIGSPSFVDYILEELDFEEPDLP
jgi:hypothetical protein